jgi:hypothetical protein
MKDENPSYLGHYIYDACLTKDNTEGEYNVFTG